MDPSTLLPIDGLSEGYGLRDDALNQLLMTTGYREVTLQYRPAINNIQKAFSSDTRLRIIALPLDEDRDPLWPHMAWMPLWSNRDTCVLVADPLEPPCRHDTEYSIPLGFAQHYSHSVEDYPYYLPVTTPEMLWPKYLENCPIRLSSAYILNPKVPHQVDDSDPTIYSITLEVILRLRAYIADQLLMTRGFTSGVTYQHTTMLYELPLPAYPDVAQSPWLLSFLLIDAARAVLTLGKLNYLTFAGLRSLVDQARTRLQELDRHVGKIHSQTTLLSRFHLAIRCFSSLRLSQLRTPSETNQFVCELLEKVGIFQTDT
ncbi:MAG: hypothetical protein ACFFDE_10410 [Promethearchaeota archaeon]